MAIGLYPSFVGKHKTNITDSKILLAVVLEVANELRWKISAINKTGFLAYSASSLLQDVEEIRVQIEGGIVYLKSSTISHKFIDWGKNRKNVTSFLDQLKTIQKNGLSDDLLIEKYKAYELKFIDYTGESVKDENLFDIERISLNGILDLLKPYTGTLFLMFINVAIFICMVSTGVHAITPNIDSLIDWGGIYRVNVIHGEYWRLLTCNYIHIGMVHLIANMYGLVYIGFLLEPVLGRLRLILVYVLTGILGSVCSLYWLGINVSAGASGAIFGLFGVFLGLIAFNIVHQSNKKALLISIGSFVLINIMLGFNEGVDNAAHIGGLLAGILFGIIIGVGFAKPKKWVVNAAVLGVFTLVLAFSFMRITINDLDVYTMEFNRFIRLEEEAMEVFQLVRTEGEQEGLNHISNISLPNWKEGKEIFQAMDSLDLPEALDFRREKLSEYCQLRINSFELLAKSIEEETSRYDDELHRYREEIDDLMYRLQNNILE